MKLITEIQKFSQYYWDQKNAELDQKLRPNILLLFHDTEAEKQKIIKLSLEIREKYKNVDVRFIATRQLWKVYVKNLNAKQILDVIEIIKKYDIYYENSKEKY